MTPRILILSVSAGAGHVRAAEAIELAVRQRLPGAYVRNVDVLQLCNRFFRYFYGSLYVDLVNSAPHLLGFLYDLLDRHPRRYGLGERLRLLWQDWNLTALVRLLSGEPWDLVINTHFTPAEIVAALRRTGNLNVPQVTATTDFGLHRLWVHQPCERYFTASDDASIYLRRHGIPEEAVLATGIPIDPVFSVPKERSTCRARHGLADDRPVVLQLSGGFGVGPIAKYLRALLEVPVPLQVVSIAGRNEKRLRQLRAVPVPPRHKVRVIGFTHDIDEYMAAADLVLSKPGGLTTSETLARGAILVIVNPTPGQECRNSDFLLENGAAIKVNNLEVLPVKVAELLRDEGRMRSLRANVRRVARPRAAFDVLEKSLELIGVRPVGHNGSRLDAPPAACHHDA
jgi:processive 1,2-diacylglycerol beta-glucosyltransferase